MRHVAAVLICLVIGIAARPATAAPTTAPSNFWLDRAAADIRDGLAHPPGNLNDVMIQQAIWLVEARGNKFDRDLLRQALNTPLPPATQPSAIANHDFSVRIMLADAYIALGDRDSARLALQSAEKAPIEGMVKLVRAELLSREWAKFGDVDRAISIETKAPFLNDRIHAYCDLAIDFDDAQNAAARDRCLHQASLAATNHMDPMYLAAAMKEVVDAEAKMHLFDAARKLADALPPNIFRFESYLLIAKRCHHASHLDEMRQAFNKAADCVDRLGSEQLSNAARLVEESVRMGDKQIALAEMNKIDGYYHPDSTPGWEVIRMPQAAAAVQDRARLDRYIQFAQDAIIRQKRDEQARSWLLVAAAWARMGERARCEAAIERSKQIKLEKDYSDSDEYGEMLTAWVESGHPEIAMHLAARDFPDPSDLDLPHAQCALAFLAAKNFPAAWNAVDQIREYKVLQVRLISKIAAAQTRPGQEDQAAARIDRISNIRSRATADVQTAGILLSLYDKWTLHDDED